ncbi:uncharacterized protein BJX67DRAFT_390361 [Aspergillus lucknowensis]|uniref:Protein kinase domain-containing protein n=1 Tax=Aspergillus lucknowensis TaxID=176173 RepID=A0ABR4LGP4_9EURO
MKYPLAPGGDMSRLEVEKKLLEIIGPHERIIRLKGLSDDGIYLERAINGTLADYLLESDNLPPSTLQRVSWWKQLSKDGTVLLDGLSGEPSRLYCPRADPFDADIKTDLFALGCTIYMILMGHPVFPDIIDGEDGWYEEVRERFGKQHFPRDLHACSHITLKCWMKEYQSAEELVQDLELIEKGIRAGANERNTE